MPSQPRLPYLTVELSNAHDRTAFDCHDESLNRYLRTQVNQDKKRGLSVCYVTPESGPVSGYYTLSSASVSLDQLPVEVVAHLPTYPSAPAMLIGRLAVAKAHAGKGLGRALLIDALRRCEEESTRIGVFAVVVDAKQGAEKFYLDRGFIPFQSRPTSMFLTMKKAKALLAPIPQ